ncbi:CPBP family intramembrane metalloprotease [Gammaproteobacteria bacterium]|nr:CPBP family intramembrane metalloprotease [Gammaproteobacteria bacterium]MDB3877777.1 CPBP family intramembrane metalloprotease [Gammaproteobacteria bacterium]MDC0089888.1 CPBP family intramembrane metalloprotease [Gammaproteobacteria bacterium]MDC0437154.1 CPBP family intramembrane metalloprotease [Gammaproteobacteria bacterium]
MMQNSVPKRRLQRPAKDQNRLINTFKQVLARHFLTMAVIAGICIFISIESFANSIYLKPLTSSPVFYFFILTAVSLFFIFFYLKRGYKIEWIHGAWLTYLLFISVVEEFAFRMMLPILLSGTFGMMSAVLFSNFLFAFIHYVTLRWKLINCVVAFIGGLGFSRLLISTEDIAILILVHYFFTFLNTPLPPERR